MPVHGAARSPSRGDPTGHPFGETANPTLYVPRDATEAALRELAQGVRSGRPAALTARPGFGKTLLLHVLAERLGTRFRAVFLPYAALAIGDLCEWALGLLPAESHMGDAGGPEPGDARRALLSASASEVLGGRVVLLIIDDANSMPVDTARDLCELVRASRGSIQTVLAATDESASSRVIVALAREVTVVRLTEPMTLPETDRYLRARLARASGIAAPFDDDDVGWMHRLSGGVPRRIHELATSLLETPPANVTPIWREAHATWLGAPFDESFEGPYGEGDLLLEDFRDPLAPEKEEPG